MRTTMLEKAGGYLADSAEQAARAASAVADAVDDGASAARHAVREGRNAAAGALHDAARQIRRKPISTTAGVFAAGVAIGLAAGWFARQS